jgi:hypothetical protein
MDEIRLVDFPPAGPVKGTDLLYGDQGSGEVGLTVAEVAGYAGELYAGVSSDDANVLRVGADKKPLLSNSTVRAALTGATYVERDLNGNLSVTDDLVARIVSLEAGAASYRCDFLNGFYSIWGAMCSLQQAVSQGGDQRDSSGRLLVQRATTNLLPNPTFAGGVVGPYNAGGILPSGVQISDPGLPWEVVSVSSGKLRIRVYRAAGTPAGTSFGIRMPLTLGVAPSRGGVVGSAAMGIVAATPNISSVTMQVNNNSTGITGFSSPMSSAGGLVNVSAFVVASMGASMYQRLQFNVVGAASDPFDATFDIQFPQLEDGASAHDCTTYVAGSRAAYATTLAVPKGSYSVNLQSRGGGVWQQVTVPDGSGWTIPVPAVGMLAIENAIVLAPQIGVPRETEFSAVMYPTKWGVTFPVGSTFSANGLSWGVQGNAAAPYAYQNATNKASLQRFEVHQGDQAPFDSGHPVDRCEASAATSFAYGVDVWISCAIFVERGTPVYDAGSQYVWCSLIQMHGNPQPGDANYTRKLAWSPCFTLDIAGDVLNIQTRSETDVYPSGNPLTMTRYVDESFQRGVYNYYVFRMVFARTGNGLLQVWRNGASIFDQAIPLGYNDALGPYMKFGIYRGTDPAVTAVQFANLEISNASLAQRVASPLPIC